LILSLEAGYPDKFVCGFVSLQENSGMVFKTGHAVSNSSFTVVLPFDAIKPMQLRKCCYMNKETKVHKFNRVVQGEQNDTVSK
jgi:hypothetical protein